MRVALCVVVCVSCRVCSCAKFIWCVCVSVCVCVVYVYVVYGVHVCTVIFVSMV